MKKVKDMPRWTWGPLYYMSLIFCYVACFLYWIFLFFDNLVDVFYYTKRDYAKEMKPLIPELKKAYKEMKEENNE